MYQYLKVSSMLLPIVELYGLLASTASLRLLLSHTPPYMLNVLCH